MRVKTFFYGAALAFCSVNLPAQSPAPSEGNPIAGVWRLNLEQSTFNPGPPPTQPSIHVYTDRGDEGILAITHGVDEQGLPEFTISLSRYDGTAVPFYNISGLAEFLATGEPIAARQRYNIINSNTIEITIREGNQVVYSSIRTVSDDRTRMHYNTIETISEGETVRNELYFDAVCGDTEFHNC